MMTRPDTIKIPKQGSGGCYVVVLYVTGANFDPSQKSEDDRYGDFRAYHAWHAYSEDGEKPPLSLQLRCRAEEGLMFASDAVDHPNGGMYNCGPMRTR